ncbi:MAG: hypothetical protein COZ34_04355 [Candidatus Pacebacteria bacterium CG_4_10_14_3_um_filter_34_15]|nr:hypothetical protein [Candidatus Pacearchaeota archaeon]NCQ65459.1 hypothetical protein [Candidatus Paceibacterota bacterium]OIO45140.1 MAG: hypothetical protein AUJ41_00765 [Candidatus Pacebacteria bacterium CG1_02_43_31]PIQ81382.1 MAG: hypothetical protein COV78_00615 [Candidatus Pacebacteria bacterium CG11_big_fil_rev_8_21_14_0_20_34_55]PIX81225.1 MAG: hypothetical protein COZ34_04355 [Candidatus Pacebacteria bacterium CG_4_10_14_3_um_filter_34_15]PJC43316.1 MAG: hypothetical protein CO0
MSHQNGFAVQQLRTQNLVKGVESLSGFVAAVVANMLIPQLLIKYVYDPTTLTVAPPVFEYLPLVTYGLALLYFVFAMVGNFRRERSARTMQKEMSLSSCCTDGSCADCKDEEISEKELKELEKIVDQALKPTKKATKKVAVKKSSAKKTK